MAVNWLDDQAAAEAVAADIRAAGRRAVLVQGSVGTAADCAALVQAALDGLGRIDVLVNNAGIFPRVEFLAMTEDDWDRVLDVNLKGSAFCAQAAARHMVAAGIKRRDPEPVLVLGARARCWACIIRRPRPASSASRGPWRWRWRRTASG